VSRPEWPGWWDWELELSPHLLKRMTDRRFTEIDLRRMLERASGYCQGRCRGPLGYRNETPRQAVGGYRRTGPGPGTAGRRHRLPGLGVRG
jgi:hypothetical protein